MKADEEYILDLGDVESFEDFIEKCNKGFIESVGGKWNGSLDAFNDYLSWPEPNPYTLVLLGENSCRKALGHAAAAKRLSAILETCHPENRKIVSKELENAQNMKGPTLWSIIVEIFDDNVEWVNVIYK